MKRLTLLTLGLLLGGCSTLHFPAVHKITIQQGNVVTQGMIDKLRPGMSMNQVRFVMGNPIIKDPLNRDRWTYFYSIKVGEKLLYRRELQLYFVDGRLSYFEGDFAPTKDKKKVAAKKQPAKA